LFGDVAVKVVKETLPALMKLKEKGVVRHIGITGLPLKIFKYVIDKVPAGTVDVVLSYCHYSLNDQSIADILPYLKQHNIGVINASPLSMGLLTPQVNALRITYSPPVTLSYRQCIWPGHEM
jgi:L-galactose dehydrogenase